MARNTNDSNPLKGIHWKTALTVGGFLIPFFGLIAGIWMTTDSKIDELKEAQLQDTQEKLTQFEGVEASLATSTEKLRSLEASSTDVRTKYEKMLAENFEQKFRAEQLRSGSLASELERLKAQIASSPQNPEEAKEASDLREKLTIVEKERDELRALYTSATAKPRDTSTSNSLATRSPSEGGGARPTDHGTSSRPLPPLSSTATRTSGDASALKLVFCRRND